MRTLAAIFLAYGTLGQLAAESHPRLEAKSYEFTLTTYDVTGTVIDQNSISFNPGYQFEQKINLGSRDEHLAIIEASAEFYTYDCEMGLQKNSNSRVRTIKELFGICDWPWRDIVREKVTTRMDVRDISEMTDDIFLVLTCTFSYSRVEISEFNDCPMQQTEHGGETVVDRSYFDFDVYYAAGTFAYVMEIIFIWLLHIFQASFYV